ncbi:MAG: hypothetical protein PHC53_02560 [Patescibacteria group bacterium]|nr:hypothetical protein [Patescibacteria group bacterium]
MFFGGVIRARVEEKINQKIKEAEVEYEDECVRLEQQLEMDKQGIEDRIVNGLISKIL